MSRYNRCIVIVARVTGWRFVSRYIVLYRDRRGVATGECVTIQILYRDRRRLDRLRCVTIQLFVS